MVEKCFTKGENKRGCKILAHLIRMYLLANQIAYSGSVTDYKVANEYYEKLRNETLPNFDEVQTQYSALLSNLLRQFKVNCFGS